MERGLDVRSGAVFLLRPRHPAWPKNHDSSCKQLPIDLFEFSQPQSSAFQLGFPKEPMGVRYPTPSQEDLGALFFPLGSFRNVSLKHFFLGLEVENGLCFGSVRESLTIRRWQRYNLCGLEHTPPLPSPWHLLGGDCRTHAFAHAIPPPFLLCVHWEAEAFSPGCEALLRDSHLPDLSAVMS